MISFARATRGLRRPSHGLLTRLGVSVGGRVRRTRAGGDQSAPIPEGYRVELDAERGRAAWSSSCSLNARDGNVLVERGPSYSLYLPLEEWPVFPLLRALNEHCFIVRVLRARRAPGRSFPHPAMMTIL